MVGNVRKQHDSTKESNKAKKEDPDTDNEVYVFDLADKLKRVTDNIIYCCRSGSATNTQAIANIIAYHLGLYQIKLGNQPLIETAANVFREICYNYRNSLTADILVAGWDKKKGGHKFTALGDMCVRQPISIGGSSSTYVYGYVDAQYKPNVTKDESLKLVQNTLALAMAHDGSSGSVMRTGVHDHREKNRKKRHIGQ